jgi:predicted TIM-barrel fold metal-dependent hydrolase
MTQKNSPMLFSPLPALDDPEGERIPATMPFVVDAHVHIFPKPIRESLWQWFDTFGYPIRYRLCTAEVFDFLLSRGVGHVVALQYAHKAGMARELNRYMADKCSQYPAQVTGMATVFPGEPDAKDILEEAFELGLKGVKLHTHVQCFDMNGKAMDVIYQVCASYGKPMVLHAGREPKSPAYKCDPYALCSADKLEQVLREYEDLHVCVPHLGMDEYVAYQRMIEKYDNLWLDTTMALTEYFPGNVAPPLSQFRADRIMYGTDFPHIPFAWDRELKCVQTAGLSMNALEQVLGKNAEGFFDIEPMEESP